METTKTRRVVVLDHRFAHVDREAAAAAAGGATFEVAQCASAADAALACADADVAVVQFAPVDARALAALRPCARVIRYGVGFDNIDVAAAAARGVAVAYVPDYCMHEVADHTAALALALSRRVVQLDAAVRAGIWNVLETASGIASGQGLSAGMLGLGRIGRETLRRLQAFGWRFTVHDPALGREEAQALGVTLAASANEVLQQAQVLLLHLPLSPTTRHIVDAAALSRLPAAAVLVNTARGGLVDEAALAQALHGGRLAGAALDVFEREPLPPDSPLRGAPNLILSPHAGWYSGSAVARLQSMVADEITRALAGQPRRCPVPGT